MDRKLKSVWSALALGLCCTACLPSSATASLANSAWPMFQHDPQHTGRGAVAGPSKLGLKWRFQVAGVPGPPAIAPDGTIYLPVGAVVQRDAAGYLYAINPDGTLRWRFQFPTALNCVIVPGVTTPAVAADGTVYVHTQSGATVDGTGTCTAGPSFLYALNPDGTEKWKFQFNFGAGVFQNTQISSPAIGPDGTVYVGSMDAGLYAIDPATGTFDWIFGVGSSMNGSPAVAPDGTIYVIQSDLQAYAPDGTPLWTADFGNSCCNGSSPAIGPDGTIYACATNPTHTCHAVSPSGAILWTVPLDLYQGTTPAIGPDGAIYFITREPSGGTAITVLNPDGSLRWRKVGELGNQYVHSVVIGADSRIYARVDNRAQAADFAGLLQVLNPDGSESGSVPIPGIHGGSGELNPAIGADGTLYVPEPRFGAGPYNPNDQFLAAYTQGSDPPDQTSPKLVLNTPFRQRLDGTIEARVKCNEVCTVKGKGTLTVNTPGAGTGRLATRRSTFKLKGDSAQLPPGRSVKLKLRVPRKARASATAALGGRGSAFARISVIATDAAGNKSRKKGRTLLLAPR